MFWMPFTHHVCSPLCRSGHTPKEVPTPPGGSRSPHPTRVDAVSTMVPAPNSPKRTHTWLGVSAWSRRQLSELGATTQVTVMPTRMDRAEGILIMVGFKKSKETGVYGPRGGERKQALC